MNVQIDISGPELSIARLMRELPHEWLDAPSEGRALATVHDDQNEPVELLRSVCERLDQACEHAPGLTLKLSLAIDLDGEAFGMLLPPELQGVLAVRFARIDIRAS